MPLVVFFVVWLLLELFVLINVASALGAMLTIGLLIAAGMFGGSLIRQQQAVFASNIQRMQSAGAVDPAQAQKMQEGMLRMLAGVLLILPGFISDVFAICLLVPALRRLFGGSLLRAFKPDVVVNRFGWGKAPGNVYEHDGSVDARRDDGTVIQGELMDPDKKR